MIFLDRYTSNSAILHKGFSQSILGLNEGYENRNSIGIPSRETDAITMTNKTALFQIVKRDGFISRKTLKAVHAIQLKGTTSIGMLLEMTVSATLLIL